MVNPFLQALAPALSLFDGVHTDGSWAPERLEGLPFFSPEAALESPLTAAVLRCDAAIEAALPSLVRICRHPRRALRVERQVVRTEFARRIPASAAEHLARHPENWGLRTPTGIIPLRVQTEMADETLDLYENRVVATVVRDVATYLRDRSRSIDRALQQEEQLYAGLFQGFRYYRQREERIRKVWRNLDRARESQRSQSLRQIQGSIERLSRGLSACWNSPLLAGPAALPSVRLPATPTNILLHDEHYLRVSRLGEVLAAAASEDDSPGPHLVASYNNFVHAAVRVALFWCGFRPVADWPDKTYRAPGAPPFFRWNDWTAALRQEDSGASTIELVADRKRVSRRTLAIVPVFEDFSRAERSVVACLQTALDAGRSQTRGPLTTIVVHPTDPRDREISERFPDRQRLLANSALVFSDPADYALLRRDRSVVGSAVVTPLDLNSLERLQHLIRVSTLAADLEDGVWPKACPVCTAPDLPQPTEQFSEARCRSCEAIIGVAPCRACKKPIPKLEPAALRKADWEASLEAGAVLAADTWVGRDRLAAFCESLSVPDSGRLRSVCPSCGVCQADKASVVLACARCSRDCWSRSRAPTA